MSWDIDAIRADLEKERLKLLEDLSNETRIGRYKRYCKRGHRMAGENLYIRIKDGREHAYCRACRKILDDQRKERLANSKKHRLSVYAPHIRGRRLQAGAARKRAGLPTEVQSPVRGRLEGGGP